MAMEPIQRRISAVMVEDITEAKCQQPGCTFCEIAGAGSMTAVVHSAEHAMATGHQVEEIHTRRVVIREKA